MAEKTTTIAVSNGAEAFLAQIKALGSVRYMFANTGTDHGPLTELRRLLEEGSAAFRSL